MTSSSAGAVRGLYASLRGRQHDLEDAAIPILEPVARGVQITLSEEERATVALWGAKTGIAIVATVPEFRDLVPVDHRLSVRQQAKPHAQTWVAYAPWSGRFHLFAGDHTLVHEKVDPTRGYRAYGAILTFAQLALKIFGFITWPVTGHVMEGDRPSIKQVWPEKGQLIHWPPPGPPAQEGNLPGLIEFVPLDPV